MDPITWTEWLTLGVSSGTVAGVVNQLIAWLRDRQARGFESEEREREREHAQNLLLDQREHEALLRAEKAHYDARSEFLPRAERVQDWLYCQLVQHYAGVEHDSPCENPNQLYSDVTADLARIARGHPTGSVRSAARKLDQELEGLFSSGRSKEARIVPESDVIIRELRACTELIDSIHQFESGPVGDVV